jgi:hypothetical protein
MKGRPRTASMEAATDNFFKSHSSKPIIPTCTISASEFPPRRGIEEGDKIGEFLPVRRFFIWVVV